MSHSSFRLPSAVQSATQSPREGAVRGEFQLHVRDIGSTRAGDVKAERIPELGLSVGGRDPPVAVAVERRGSEGVRVADARSAAADSEAVIGPLPVPKSMDWPACAEPNGKPTRGVPEKVLAQSPKLELPGTVLWPPLPPSAVN